MSPNPPFMRGKYRKQFEQDAAQAVVPKPCLPLQRPDGIDSYISDEGTETYDFDFEDGTQLCIMVRDDTVNYALLTTTHRSCGRVDRLKETP